MVFMSQEETPPLDPVVSFILTCTGSDTDRASQRTLDESVFSDTLLRSDCSLLPMGHAIYRIRVWTRLLERGSYSRSTGYFNRFEGLQILCGSLEATKKLWRHNVSGYKIPAYLIIAN